MDEMNTPSTLPEDQTTTDHSSEDSESKSSHHGYSHHHHHHHHHHGHSRHKRKHSHSRGRGHRTGRIKKKFTKFWQFVKKKQSVLVNVVSCTISVVLLVLLVLQFENSADAPLGNDTTVGATQSSIKIESTIYVDDVSLVDRKSVV